MAWFSQNQIRTIRCESGDSRESEIRVFRANRPDSRYENSRKHFQLRHDSRESIRANRVANRYDLLPLQLCRAILVGEFSTILARTNFRALCLRISHGTFWIAEIFRPCFSRGTWRPKESFTPRNSPRITAFSEIHLTEPKIYSRRFS